MTDTRYPYTYACDYIRAFGPVSRKGVVLSRSDASQIMKAITKALDMDKRDLACQLADAQLVRQEDPAAVEAETKRLMTALGII